MRALLLRRIENDVIVRVGNTESVIADKKDGGRRRIFKKSTIIAQKRGRRLKIQATAKLNSKAYNFHRTKASIDVKRSQCEAKAQLRINAETMFRWRDRFTESRKL
jgi:hypothetical protein